MFWISSAVFTSATILFLLFGSAETQPWNDVSQQKVPTISDEETRMTEIPTKESRMEEEEEDNEYKASL